MPAKKEKYCSMNQYGGQQGYYKLIITKIIRVVLIILAL